MESLFLEVFTRDGEPLAWLAVAATVIATVALYNKYSAITPMPRLFTAVCLISTAALVALKLVEPLWPEPAIFALYVWKDIYIVFLIEMFWSYANVVFKLQQARWTYGLLLVAGTLGSIGGNLLGGQVAVSASFDSSDAVWLVVPCLLGTVAGFRMLVDHLPQPDTAGETPESLSEGFRVLRENRYLARLVGLICMTQIVITLVDYIFKGAVEQGYPDTDARTEVIGFVYTAIDVGSLVLQAAAGPVLRFAGVGLTLLAIPVILGTSLAVFALVPQTIMVIIGKVASKAFDYSLFRAAKELLYIPLSYREKLQGKAIVDILTYRVAKALVSLMLLGFIALGSQDLANVAALVAVAVWMWLTVGLVRRYRELTD